MSIKDNQITRLKSLRKELDSAEKYRSIEPSKAFIEWYLEARFGRLGADQKYILDGAGEAGIDAIVYKDKFVYIFQFKYEIKPRVRNVKRDEIAAFETIAKRILGHSSESENLAWLQKIRPQSRGRIIEIEKAIARKEVSARFYFVASHSYTLEPSSTVEIVDVNNILALWDLYQEGFTPPADRIDFEMSSHWNYETVDNKTKKKTYTHVGLADVKELRRAMKENKNDVLFSQNVRTDLRSEINKDIRLTYEKDPERFWIGNNGIYIVCKDVTIKGNRFELLYPSIINGSQTLHSIDGSNYNHSCKILVRILAMDFFDDQRLLSDVIRRTNTQNPMKLENLSAHDLVQLNIARYLDRYKIFYERRQAEWKNEKKDILTRYVPLKLKTLAQWLSITRPNIGLGTARANVKSLFISKNYDQIFANFDPGLTSRDYKTLIPVVWSGFFIQALARNFSGKQLKSHFQISSLLFLKIFSEILQDSLVVLDEKLTKHSFGKRYIPRNIIMAVKDIIKLIEIEHAKYQRKDSTKDFSNYFKSNDLTNHVLRKIKISSKYNKFKKAIDREIMNVL